MNKIIAGLVFFVVVFAWATDSTKTDSTKTVVKPTEASMKPCEKVLVGVLLINDSYSMNPTQRFQSYKALLKESGVTHAEFQQYLTEAKSSSKKWFKTLERLDSVFTE